MVDTPKCCGMFMGICFARGQKGHYCIKCGNCTITYGEWISVKDKLPPQEDHVLVFDETEGICCGYLRDDDWAHYPMGDYGSGACLFHVTHWMPLPKSPEDL